MKGRNDHALKAAKEPYITKAQKLQEIFPEALLVNGAVHICPRYVSAEYRPLPDDCMAETRNCADCMESFWKGKYYKPEKENSGKTTRLPIKLTFPLSGVPEKGSPERTKYDDYVENLYGCPHEWGEPVTEDVGYELTSRKCKKCGIVHAELRDGDILLMEYYDMEES